MNNTVPEVPVGSATGPSPRGTPVRTSAIYSYINGMELGFLSEKYLKRTGRDGLSGAVHPR